MVYISVDMQNSIHFTFWFNKKENAKSVFLKYINTHIHSHTLIYILEGYIPTFNTGLAVSEKWDCV